MQKKIFMITAVILLISGVSACASQPAATSEVSHGEQVTFAVETVYAQIALTSAAAEAMATPTPVPTNTPEPTLTPTIVIPTPTPTDVFSDTTTDGADDEADTAVDDTPAQEPTQPPSAGMPCHKANLEYETIPDGTELAPEVKFIKVWRIKNVGSCTWNKDYSLRFYDGDLLGAEASILLTDEDIPTWGYANIEVPMQAPAKSGVYKGYWKIVSDTGKIFGVGPDGKGWIWIEIKVIE